MRSQSPFQEKHQSNSHNLGVFGNYSLLSFVESLSSLKISVLSLSSSLFKDQTIRISNSQHHDAASSNSIKSQIFARFPADHFDLHRLRCGRVYHFFLVPLYRWDIGDQSSSSTFRWPARCPVRCPTRCPRMHRDPVTNQIRRHKMADGLYFWICVVDRSVLLCLF